MLLEKIPQPSEFLHIFSCLHYAGLKIHHLPLFYSFAEHICKVGEGVEDTWIGR